MPRGGSRLFQIRPALRKVTLAPEECLCSADMYPMTGKNGMSTNYLLWLFLSDSLSEWIVLDSDRVAMPKVNRDTLNDYWLPVPPIDEQRRIVEFIIKQNERTDVLDREGGGGGAAVGGVPRGADQRGGNGEGAGGVTFRFFKLSTQT